MRPRRPAISGRVNEALLTASWQPAGLLLGANLALVMSMRAFAEAWPSEEIIQHAVGQLFWGHNLGPADAAFTPAQGRRISAPLLS
jgi:hypothetical protein